MAETTEGARPRWGQGLTRLDQAWVRVEQRIAVWVLITEVITLVGWVSLKGLATTYVPGTSVIGLIFRSAVTAMIFGAVTHFVTKPKTETPRTLLIYRLSVSGAALLGLLLGRAWVGVGVEWASNMVEWLQNASVFMLVGGPRGAVTRLTLWLALLGASLAASSGKHINIDVALRFLPERLVTPAGVVSWLAAALVCFSAAFGFVDSIAVTKFKAEAFTACGKGVEGGTGKLCDTPVSARLATVIAGAGQDFFLLRRQLSLDLMSAPKVLTGTSYDKYLDGPTWNAWVKEGEWERYFPADSVQALMARVDDPTVRKMPAVVAPDSGEGRDLLIRDLNFILPFGLFVIGLKFLLRILRVLSGEAHVEAGESQHEDDLKHGHDPIPENP